MKRPSPATRIRHLFTLRRRTLAALAAFVAVLAGLSAMQPTPPETAVVLVAAADLPGGTRLADADVTRATVPTAVLPRAAAHSTDEVVGRLLNGPVTRGTILTSASVAIGSSLVQPGFVVAPLPLADDAIAPLVAPGTRIDIIGLDAENGEAIATDVRVVGAPDTGTDGVLGSTADPTALVEVTPAVAVQLARAAQTGGVTVALRS